ncbi:gamma-glutamyltransferase [Allorhizobium borbori]|uniref:Glutathione hydrolase proenzyme n=1 Tax=Allorhizobium borbori TaxID=485907 RepID=A0A7W6K748_9HYPH|nr:gamma-glutamyltransferase [Allorhizobium borbori]MBB4105227.1 gamma-glutamyltranspeptidase/glutathione hydrolase [Allorhizobium borbori]
MSSRGMPLPFTCRKRPASGTGGVVVTNHPLGSAAGHEMLAAGGNAIDAAVASLFALTVVEPMMVGIAGGGLSHVRLGSGEHFVIDMLSSAPAAATPEMFTPVADSGPDYIEAAGRRNQFGAASVAVPGNLAGWCMLHERHGRLPFADLLMPAIRYAENGFAVSSYLVGTIGQHAADMLQDTVLSKLYLPSGSPLSAGSRLVQGDYAESLRLIAKQGASALHGGALGAALVARLALDQGPEGKVSMDDLRAYRPVRRTPITGSYRGHEIVGPPPPASSGVHVTEMLNMLEAYDLAGMGFDNAERIHLLLEVIRIAFEDRRAASGDPDFVDIPVDRFTSKAYAAQARARLRQVGGAISALPAYESHNTTHVTVSDRDGNIVSATHTINGLFGARFMVPDTGIIPNNYMHNFDPHPGKALSIAPGKRVPTSMAPMIVLKGGRPAFALGLPGAVRIFPSAMQAIVNLIDHGMSLQEAVEAPRVWTDGGHIELEPAFAHHVEAMRLRGHDARAVAHIGGGMNAIAFGDDGEMTGAACWRADGTVSALGGGLADEGVTFLI